MNPAGADLCVDKSARDGLDWNAAANACAAAGFRLPSPSELIQVARAGLLANGAVHWTDDTWFDPNTTDQWAAYDTAGVTRPIHANALGVWTACVATTGNQFSH
jgi:hypothetical protein